MLSWERELSTEDEYDMNEGVVFAFVMRLQKKVPKNEDRASTDLPVQSSNM